MSTRSPATPAEIARMAADAIAYRSHDDCAACQISTTGECETAQADSRRITEYGRIVASLRPGLEREAQ